MFGLSKASAVYSTHEFVEELCNFKNQFIKFPNSRAELQRNIEGFSEITEIPNVVAAIDGSHIPIKKPPDSGEDYCNRKFFYSYVVQGIVDSSKLYLSVSTGYPGSMHDARVLRLSEVFRAAEADEILNEPTFDVNGTIIRPLILGDSANPLKTWLLRPFKDNGALNQHQKNFNNHLSVARVKVEHAFGETKGRWRNLQKRLGDASESIPDTVIACCILHNICILRGDNYDGDDDGTDDDDSDDEDNGPPSQEANSILDAIVDYLN